MQQGQTAPVHTIIGNTQAADLSRLTARSFGAFKGDARLRLPKADVIRAGVRGGLANDSVVTDLFQGCLPANKICYGECFAAREAFEKAGVDFGQRVRNRVDGAILADDLKAIPHSQGFMRSGWNSDLSWGWNDDDALAIIRAIYESQRHPVILTKAFTALKEERMDALIPLDTELRVCVSAFDTDAQIKFRLSMMERYREKGGLSVPILMSAAFKDPVMRARQDALAAHLVALDLPAGENSIRFNTRSPVLECVDVAACGPVEDSGDVWAGLLYRDLLTTPTLSSTHEGYRGVDPYRSRNDRRVLDALFTDPVPTNEQVRSGASFRKPKAAGVPKTWAPD